MKIEDLRLASIDGQAHLSSSEEMIAAIGFAARAGYKDHTVRRFFTALVMMNQLGQRGEWGKILRRVQELQIEEQIATLRAGRPVAGEIRE